jgi:hypothetical protein
MFCSVVGAISGSYFKPDGPFKLKMLRPPLHRPVLYTANAALASGVGGAAYAFIQANVSGGEAALILSTLAYTAVYFAVNTAGIAVTIGLAQQKPIVSLWRENFLWTAPGFFASASIAVAAYLGYAKFQLWSLMIGDDCAVTMDRENERFTIACFGHIFEMSAANGCTLTTGGATLQLKDSAANLLGQVVLGGRTPHSQVLFTDKPGTPVVGTGPASGLPALGVWIGV